MNSRTVGRMAVTLLAAVLALAGLGGPAIAAPPVVERNALPPVVETFDCGGGVTYDLDLAGYETVRAWLGPAGPTRILTHVHWKGTAVASTGSTLRLNHAFTVDEDFLGGTVTFVGLPFGVWVDGSAMHHVERGIIVIDSATFVPLFEAGFHLPPDPEAHTCALLAAAAA